MAELTNLKFLDLAGLGEFKDLLTSYIDEQDAAIDAKSIKGVAINGNTLEFYKVEPIDGEGVTPAYKVNLPKEDLTGLLPKFEAAVAGNVVTVATDGETIVDSGVAVADLATKAEVTEVEAKANEAKSAADAVDKKVGVIPNGEDGQPVSENVIAYVNLKAQEVLDSATGGSSESAASVKLALDTYKSENDPKVKANTDAIAVLNSDATTEGSVKKTVANEIAKIVAEAPEDLNTLKEISDWISSHETDAAGMNSKILANKSAIEALDAFVGELPEGATATTVVGYISEALEKADLTKYALASDLTDAIARIAANETAIGVINTALAEGGTTYNAIVEAKKAGTDAQTAVDTLKSFVGTYTVDDESIDTIVKYIDYKVKAVNDALEARIKALEDAMANKADASDVDALGVRMATAETNITNNTTAITEVKSTVDSIGSIDSTDIAKLFETTKA